MRKRTIVGIIALLLMSWGVIRPLMSPSYFPMHDDTQVARVVEMGRALREGQFPVRWVGDLGYGYGYPIYNFYGPLPYYVGGTLFALGVPAVTATKLMFGIGTVLPAIVLAFVLSSILGWQGALVGAAAYLYGPYHAVQIYIRGAVGEYWVMMFWPLLFAAFVWGRRKQFRARAFLSGAIGTAGSVISHTLLGYATVLLWGVFICVYGVLTAVRNRPGKKRFRTLLTGLTVGLGLSAFFWAPAFYEMGYTNVAGQISKTADYRDHFVCAVQLWSSSWGFGGSSAGCVRDGLSFMMGKLHILLVLGVIASWMLGKLKAISREYMYASLAVVGIGVYLTLAISAPVWAVLPKFSYMQYPWRFLSVALFGTALVSALVPYVLRTRVQRLICTFVLVVLFAGLYTKRFVPQQYTLPSAGQYETAADIRFRASRMSDEYLPKDVYRPASEREAVSDTIESSAPADITPVIDRMTLKRYVVESTSSALLTMHTANFPGWKYRVNGDTVVPSIVDGLPRISVGAGQSVVELMFVDTPVRTAGNIVSVLSFVLAGYLYVTYKKVIG